MKSTSGHCARISVPLWKEGNPSGLAASPIPPRNPKRRYPILPGESGFEICERLKAHRDTVPVLVLSAIDLESSRNLAAKAGADGYLSKPIREAELHESIASISKAAFRRAHRDKSKDEGNIRFGCRCGKRFKVSIKRQGKMMTCTNCGDPLTVPRQA